MKNDQEFAGTITGFNHPSLFHAGSHKNDVYPTSLIALDALISNQILFTTYTDLVNSGVLKCLQVD